MNLVRMKYLFDKIEDKMHFYRTTKISPSSFSYVLQGKNQPSVKTIEKFAAYCKVPCGSLFDDYEQYNDKFIHVNNKIYRKALILNDAILYYND
jgi:transcriptional regulator with XRE-family HTH domain